jgi:DNA-binding NtrC family response regulator
MLSMTGYQVKSASDARTALANLKANPVDILLTEVELPDLPGVTLAEYATFRFPSLAVIFITGRGPGPSLPAHTATCTLVKPFTFEELTKAIGSLAEGRGR